VSLHYNKNVVMPSVMGKRPIHLGLEIPVFDIPPFFVGIDQMLCMGGLGRQTP
jgi:hypothetical protein